MPKRNIDDIYTSLQNMMGSLDDIMERAKELVQTAGNFGGEIKRIIQEQMNKYFIPTINNLKEDENTPGCLKAQISFLDSLYLWQIRVEDEPEGSTTPNPEDMPQPDLNLPASASVDNTADIPQNASYQTSIHEALEKFRVIRKSKPSELGEDVAQTEDTIIGEYNTKEEAGQHCKVLNDMVSPEEREYLGTEYEVKEVVFEDGEIKMK